MQNDDDFSTVRDARKTSMRLSRETPGLGILSHQAIPWTLPMLLHVLNSDALSLWTPAGLTRLIFFLIGIYFMPRIRTEMMNICRGDFVRLLNPDGSVRAVIYVPHGLTKKDRGNSTAKDSAGYFKRPMAVKGRKRKFDFDYVLSKYEEHLDLLPHEGDRKRQKLFHKLRKDRPAYGECFFRPGNLGSSSFDMMVRDAAREAGLFLHERQMCNQALRTTVFCLHEQLGINPTTTSAMAGHSSEKTKIIYQRAHSRKSADANAKIQAILSNHSVEYEEDSQCKLLDGEVVTVTSTGEERLPLEGLSLEEFFKSVPEI